MTYKDIEGAGKTGNSPTIQNDTVRTEAKVDMLIGLSEGVVRGFGKTFTTDDIKKNVYMNDTPIMASDGTQLIEADVEFRSGTIDQAPIDGIPYVTIENQINVTVTDTAPVSRSFTRKEVTKYDVRISIPALYTNDSSGNSSARALSFAIDVAQDDGSFTTYRQVDLNDKTTSGFQRTYTVELAGSGTRYIRVRRITPQANNPTYVADSLVVEGITEIVDIKPSYPHTALLRVSFSAKAFSSAPKVTVRMYGKADLKIPANYDPDTRTYATTGQGTTNGLWDGTFKLGYSDNPVWQWLDITTSERYSLGKRLKLKNQNIYYLYKLAQYCDELVSDGAGGQEPRFTSNNLYLQSKQDAREVFKQIAAIFRAKQMYDGQHLVPVADIPREPKYVFSRSNMTSVVYSSTSSDARHNVVNVQYYDTTNQYKSRYAHARDTDDVFRRGRVVDTSLQGTACTSEGQAQRQANYVLVSELTETEMITFTTGMEGVYPRIGDVILIADELVAGTTLSGRVVNVTADNPTITLDHALTDSNNNGYIMFNSPNAQELISRKIVSYKDNDVTLDSPVPTEVTELVWAVTSPVVEPVEFTIDNCKFDVDNFTWTITAIQYNKKKHTAADVAAARNDIPSTIITPLIASAPTKVTASYTTAINQGSNENNVSVEWTQANNAVKYQVEMSRNSSNYVIVGTVAQLHIDVPNLSTGIYSFRVRAFDALGNGSSYTVSNYLDVAGKLAAPLSLPQFKLTGILFGMTMAWTYPAGAEDSRAVRIMYTYSDPSTTTNPQWTTQDIAYPATEYVLQNLAGRTPVWAKAAIVDSYGQVGDYSAIATSTATVDTDKVMDIISGSIKQSDLFNDLSQKIDLGANASQSAKDAQAAADTANATAASASATADKATQDAQTAQDSIKREIKDREAAVSEQQTAWQKRANEIQEGINTETQSRKDADSTTNTRIDSMKSSYDGSMAALQQTQSAQAAKQASEASRTDNVIARLDNDKTGLNALSSSIDKTNTRVGKTEGNITAQGNKISSLEATVGANKAQADQTFATKTDLQGAEASLTTALNSAANNAQSNSEAYTRNYSYSKSEADKAVSGSLQTYDASLTIGGRNLLLNSNFYRGDTFGWGSNGGNFSIVSDATYGSACRVSGSNNNGLFFAPNKGWVDNGKYTVSVLIRNLAGKLKFGVESSGTIVADWIIQASNDNIWRKYYITFQKFGVVGAVYLYLDGGGSFDITNAMLEEGTKATDWTPAPEDIDSKVNDVSASLSSFQQAQATVNSATTQRLDNAASQLSGQQATITSIQQTYAKTSEVGSIARNSMTSVFTNGINLARKTDVVRGYLVNGKIGASSNDYTVPTLYPADAGDWFSGSTYQTLNVDDFRGQIAFYDSNINFISQSEILKRENNVIHVQAPSGTAYFRISYPIPFYGYVKVERGKLGTTYSVPPEDGASADSVNNLSSSIAQTYATKSDLSSTEASMQTLVRSSAGNGSGNLLGNADFSGNDPLYLWRYSGTGNYDGLNVWGGADDWRLQSSDSRTVYMHSMSLGAGMFDEMATDFLVEAGKIYQVSAYTGAHRSRVIIFVYYWDANNNVIATSFDKTLNNMNNMEALGGKSLSGYKRIFQNVTAPSNCVKMSLVVRRDNADIGDPYAFVVRAQAVEVQSLNANLVAWQKGSLTTNYTKLVDSSVMTNYATKSDMNTTVANATQQLDSKYQTGGATNRFYNSDFIFGLNGWNSNGSTNTVVIDQGNAKQTFGATRVVQVVSAGAWSQGLWQSVDNLGAGNKVTISVWMYGFTDNSVGLTFGIADENITPDSGFPQYQTVLAGWNRYRITGTWRNNGNVVLYVHFTGAGQKVMMARPQLETGAMLTDWKAANGDVEDQFTNQAAAISNTYTKAATDVAISGAINTYSANLSIGGRNYFKKSTGVVDLGNSSGIARTDTGFVATGRYQNDSQVRILDLVPETGTYTVSFEHNMDSGSFPITIELSDQSSFTFQAQSGIWQKVVGTLTTTQVSPQNWIDVINLTGQQHRFRNFKVEKGTKATDWTPAPEDISSALDANARAVSDTQAKVSTIDGQVSALASKTDTISATVGNNTSAIQQQMQVTNGLSAKATLQLEAGNVIGGVALGNNGGVVDAIFRVNKFSVVPPTGYDQTPQNILTFYATSQTLPNGSVIPAGLKVSDAMIGRITADKLDVGSLSAITGTFGTFTTVGADGSKCIQTGGKKEVYDANGVLRYRDGVW